MIHFDNFLPTGYQVDTSVFANIGDMLIQRDGLIASLAGNNRIVSGVVNDGNDNYSEGFIVFGGKPYRFLPGQLKPKLKIKRIAHTRADENGEQKPSHYEDVLEFSSDVAAEIVFADLQRWYPNQPMFKELKFLGYDVTNADLTGTGWFVADGQNGTDNWLDRFPVAAGNTYNVGDTGGASSVQLTASQMPSHTHSMRLTAGAHFDSNARNPGGTGSGARRTMDEALDTRQTGSKGSNAAHENRPPYKAARVIQFIGI